MITDSVVVYELHHVVPVAVWSGSGDCDLAVPNFPSIVYNFSIHAVFPILFGNILGIFGGSPSGSLVTTDAK